MKKQQHILFLSSWYPSRVSPLIGDFIQRHAEAVALLHTVTVVHVISDSKVKKSIEIFDKEIRGVRTLIAYIKPSSTKMFHFVKAYKQLLIKAGKFDIVHVNKLFPVGIIALYLKFTKGIKYLCSEHHHIYYYPFNKNIGFVEKQFSKLITRNASYICPVTNDLGNTMQAFGLKGNYHKVGNVVKTDVFKPKNRERNTRFTLLHVSGKSKIKNVKGILNTIAELQKKIPNFMFYLIGERSKEYQELANSLSINPNNIVFIDQLSQAELASYYQKADVFVLFSEIETFSIVIYEAFSSGTPVVSSDLSAIRENFPDNYGVLVEKGNTEQLLEDIIKIHEGFVKASPQEMHNYVAENFSSISIAKQFAALYNKMLL